VDALEGTVRHSWSGREAVFPRRRTISPAGTGSVQPSS